MSEEMAPNGDWLDGFLRRTEDLLVSNTQRIIALEKGLEEDRAWWRENQERWRQNEERWMLNVELWQRNFENWRVCNERWDANQKLLEHMLAEIRDMKRGA